VNGLRRLFTVTALLAGSLAILALASARAAFAHPLGNFTVNRYSGIVVSPGRVSVLYVVDMAEIPTFQEMPNIDTNGDGTATESERLAWADRTALLLLRNMSLSMDGRPVQLSVDKALLTFRPGQAGLPILRLEVALGGELTSVGQIAYRDRNYPGRIGWKEITARSNDGVALVGSNVPAASVSDELRGYPADLLSSPLDETQAVFTFHPGRGSAAPATISAGRTVSGAPIASGGAFAALVRWKLTPVVLALSLMLAFLFGALHALGPGHGKTITAAYLVGAGARRRQAVAIGLAISIMHTASVLALGLVALVLIKSFPAERAYPWLTMTTGMVALTLGASMLVLRVRSRKRGLDPWHGHTHGHGEDHGHGDEDHEDLPDHDHRSMEKPISGRGLMALAVAGGILPSPTALVVLTGAIAAHRIGYGLTLIMAFSLGLAAALMGVGVAAIRARSFVAMTMGARVSSWIPILSAAVIIGFGAFFAERGLRITFAPAFLTAGAAGLAAAIAAISLAGRSPAPAARRVDSTPQRPAA
jgi:nickel/cobalt exporter